MKIQILHLANGTHQFDEIVKPGSLNFAEGEYFPNAINLHIVLNKFNQNITCHIHLETQARFECDRCLEPFEQKITDDFEMLFSYGHDEVTEDQEDVIKIQHDTREIDLSERIMQSLILATPLKKLCSEECKGICPHCGADLNKEKCKCPDTDIDPRWDKLRKMLK